ncbi:MAG: hypothetical protein ABIJ16_03260 [Bacteroidota bacterium]
MATTYTSYTLIEKIAHKLLAKAIVIEVALAIIAGTGYYMLIEGYDPGREMFLGAAGLLALYYLLTGFRNVGASPRRDARLLRYQGFSYTVAIVGLMLVVTHLPGGLYVMMAGVLMLFVLAFFILFGLLKQRSSQFFDYGSILRVAIMVSLVSYYISKAGGIQNVMHPPVTENVN